MWLVLLASTWNSGSSRSTDSDPGVRLATGLPSAGASSGSRTAWTMRRTWKGESSHTWPWVARVPSGLVSVAPTHCHTPSLSSAPLARALLIRTSATSAGGRVTSTVPGAVEVGAT